MSRKIVLSKQQKKTRRKRYIYGKVAWPMGKDKKYNDDMLYQRKGKTTNKSWTDWGKLPENHHRKGGKKRGIFTWMTVEKDPPVQRFDRP